MPTTEFRAGLCRASHAYLSAIRDERRTAPDNRRELASAPGPASGSSTADRGPPAASLPPLSVTHAIASPSGRRRSRLRWTTKSARISSGDAGNRDPGSTSTTPERAQIAVGLLAAPGLPAEVAESLAPELSTRLNELYPEVQWAVPLEIDGLVVPPCKHH